jgi:hypothetical protein
LDQPSPTSSNLHARRVQIDRLVDARNMLDLVWRVAPELKKLVTGTCYPGVTSEVRKSTFGDQASAGGNAF